jgi:hypothetical protein
MNTSNHQFARPELAAAIALRFNRAASFLKQKLPAAIAPLTLCAVSLDPLPSMAAENGGAKKTTTVKLKESGTTFTTATLFHLTAAVSPSRASGTVTFSCATSSVSASVSTSPPGRSPDQCLFSSIASTIFDATSVAGML